MINDSKNNGTSEPIGKKGCFADFDIYLLATALIFLVQIQMICINFLTGGQVYGATLNVHTAPRYTPTL